MGRPKLPSESHKKRGTFRPDRHATAPLPIEVPEMPLDLPPLAQAVWKNVTTKLFAAGLIADIDQVAVRMLAESVWLYQEAHDDIIAKGLIVTTTNGNIQQNPAVGIRNKAWEQIVKLCRQFGMTPSARTGLPAGVVAEEDDAESAIIGFKAG